MVTSHNSLQPIYLLDFHVFSIPERYTPGILKMERHL